jgi:hypothetical protein
MRILDRIFGPIGGVLVWTFNKIIYQERIDSVLSLRVWEQGREICLNDIAKNSYTAFGKDPEPQGTVWIKSNDFTYAWQPAKGSAIPRAVITLHRKIEYVPIDPRAQGVAFLSATRTIRGGNVRSRRRRVSLAAAKGALDLIRKFTSGG